MQTLKKLNKQLQVLVFCFCSSFSVYALAASNDVVNPYVQLNLIKDDNVLKLHDAATAKANFGNARMADTVEHGLAGLKLSTMLSLQKISAEISVNTHKYSHFKQFDNVGKDANLNWNWNAGKFLSGNLSTSYSTSQLPFRDYRLTDAVMSKVRKNSFDAAWMPLSNWRVRTAYTDYLQLYDAAILRQSNSRFATYDLGLDYLSYSSGSAGVQLRRMQAKYPNFSNAANNYRQDEVKANIDWRFSDKTQVKFLGGMVKKVYLSDMKKDFSGVNLRLLGNWTPSTKTSVTINAWRELASIEDVNAGFSLSNGVSLNSAWEVTPKIRLDASFKSEKRDYTGNIIPLQYSYGRNDHFKEMALTLNYLPIQHAQLGLTLAREKLDSSVDAVSYRSNAAQMNLRYDFGSSK